MGQWLFSLNNTLKTLTYICCYAAGIDSCTEKETEEEEEHIGSRIRRRLDPDDQIEISYNCSSVDGLDKIGVQERESHSWTSLILITPLRRYPTFLYL